MDFPKDLVIEMQVNATKKAKRTMIGRTLGGRASFKMLLESLKLHLPASFVSVTLLTKGFFLILFEDEEGATATRKLAAVEWSGLSLSFSRYNPNFDANAQGAQALLTHAIKVQFLDLHEQFRNERALTIMASKLGEVLDIEAADSYIKRSAGPMVMIEVKEITNLAGYIRIPSMAEGAAYTDTIRQKVLYSGLPNQCRKCRRFGHQARSCNTVTNFAQEGVAHRASAPREMVSKNTITRPMTEMATRVRAQNSSAAPRHEAQIPDMHRGGEALKHPRNQISVPTTRTGPAKIRSSSPSSDPERRSTSIGDPDNRMEINPTSSPRRAEEGTRADDKKPPTGAMTPRNSITFELPGSDCPKAQNTGKSVNPFASPVDGNQGGDEQHRCQEELPEGWSFQGRRKHAPKTASPRPELKQVPARTPQQEPTSGGKRQHLHSEVHATYFSSLGIDAPSTGEPFRARIWPVLTTEKNAIRETLVYSKNQARSSLPLSLRITGPTEAEWTQVSAWADLTQRLEIELEEKVLRYKLPIKARPRLEWSWMKESSRAGTECTILAHIDSGTSALSI